MDAKRWRQIKEIYDRALDLCGDEREDFLAEACGDDVDLRREVESLLAAHIGARTFLQAPAVEVAEQEIVGDEFTSTVAAKLPAAPQLIGQDLANYKIISLLGKGGMGEVYLAEDTRLRRNVALKLLAPQFTNDADAGLESPVVGRDAELNALMQLSATARAGVGRVAVVNGSRGA